MSFLLDTNTCIDFLRGREEKVRQKMVAVDPSEVGVSVVTVAELRHGAERSSRVRQNHELLEQFLEGLDVLPLDEASARAYGSIRAHVEAAGKAIGPNDLFIAAHAVALRRTLVTNNTAEFRSVPGLRLVDWR